MLLKIGIATIVIGFASWLAGKKPELAGFIIALPIVSLLALAFLISNIRIQLPPSPSKKVF